MARINPLIAEVLAGFARPGPMHLVYLNYLLLQAGVLLLWWPKGALLARLESEAGPATLLAVLVAVGASVAYYSIRAGAEELLLPGQSSLREWVLATPLKLGRILRGYLCGHILQTLHAIMLSSPLLLMAYAVAGDEWTGLVWSVTAILFQAAFYRLVGAVLYLLIGHYEVIMFLALRVVLVLGFLIAGALIPLTGYWRVSYHLLNGVAPTGFTGFVVVHTVSALGLVGVLYLLLSRQRRGAGEPQ